MARVTVDALPPSVNWSRLQFSAVHNVTGEVAGIIQGEPVAGGREGTVLTGLRPGEVYKLLCWAENASNVQGVVQNTFSATAIGGGASVTTFTAPGYVTLPANVASCSAAQGVGKTVNVSWPAVATANLREYVLQRNSGSGFVEVWRGQGRAYVDRAVTYGTSYTYRVRARDLWGNQSTSWATSLAITLTTGTIVGGASSNDIGSNTVATVNRTQITRFSGGYTTPLLHGYTMNFPHSLGKTPTVTSMVTARSGNATWTEVIASNSTDVSIQVFAAPQTSTSAVVPASPHSHTVQATSSTGTAFIDIW